MLQSCHRHVAPLLWNVDVNGLIASVPSLCSPPKYQDTLSYHREGSLACISETGAKHERGSKKSKKKRKKKAFLKLCNRTYTLKSSIIWGTKQNSNYISVTTTEVTAKADNFTQGFTLHFQILIISFKETKDKQPSHEQSLQHLSGFLSLIPIH